MLLLIFSSSGNSRLFLTSPSCENLVTQYDSKQHIVVYKSVDEYLQSLIKAKAQTKWTSQSIPQGSV
jgi:hypothetical protein